MGSSYITLGLVTISSIVVVIAAIPYILEIIRGKVKPRVVSWFVWTVLTVIAGCASFTDGQYTTAILMLCASITTMLVVVLGWQRGDRRIDRVDILCLIGASIGLVLWQLLQSPALAVIVMVGIDFIGGIPTLFHAWKRPYEELWFTFFLASVGSLCTLLAITEWKITSVVYPIFLVLINAILAAIILLRQKRVTMGGSSELQKL